ncbi:hypothetical protein AU377_12855 [Sporosarcina sp. HYO08]|nr:hypothetical protein AU377_12855 [Sporosarcina sp. HYO08]
MQLHAFFQKHAHLLKDFFIYRQGQLNKAVNKTIVSDQDRGIGRGAFLCWYWRLWQESSNGSYPNMIGKEYG